MKPFTELALLTAAIAAALAIGASTASAQTLEVLSEHPAGGHCGNVTVTNHLPAGGCAIHATTEPNTTVDFFAHISGVGEVQFSGCENEFEARINEDGLGYIYNQQLTDEEGSPIPCGIAPCDEAAPSHAQHEWPIVAWEGGGGNEALATTFCFRPVEASEGAEFSYCTFALEASQTGHGQEFTAGDAAGDGNSCLDTTVEWTGHWITSPEDPTGVPHGEIEIVHIHPGS